MFNGNNGYQVNGYNEADVNRLSNIIEGEDPIAQAMGLQQPQTQHVKPIEYRNDIVYNTQRQPQPQPIQQINANGKQISISISPDGTITISIGG